MATLSKHFESQKVDFDRKIENLQKEIQKKQWGHSIGHTPGIKYCCYKSI